MWSRKWSEWEDVNELTFHGTILILVLNYGLSGFWYSGWSDN